MRFDMCLTLLSLSIASLVAGCAPGSTDTASEDEDGAEEVGESREALVGCYGESCNGQDPGAMGCEVDATTVASSPIYNSTLQAVGVIAMRRSMACNALWARASTSSGTAFLRAEMVRTPASAGGASQSTVPTAGWRSPMAGFSAGSTYKAKGGSGPIFNFYPNTGEVNKAY